MTNKILEILNQPGTVGVVMVLGFLYLKSELCKIVKRLDARDKECENRFKFCVATKLQQLDVKEK